MKKLYSLLLLLVSATVFAQSYNFTVYNTNNSGVGGNSVKDIKMSSSGTLWIATNNGLSKMVGSSFTNYNTSNSTIGTDILNKIAVAGTTVWVSTYSNGIIRYNGTTFTNFNTNQAGMPNNTATGIATDGSGNLWMASSSGLSKFNGTTWTTYNTSNSQILSNNVTSVFTDSSNNVWISASGALMKFNGTTFTIINDQVEKILKVVGNTIYVDTFDGFGKIVGTDYTGFYLVDNSSCLASCAVEALGVDETNKVWLGLDNCDNYAGGIQRFTDCTTYRTSNSILPDNSITSIHVVDSNVIWAGTLEGGLVKMNKTDGGCGSPTNLGVYQESISTYAAQLYWTPANPTTSGYTYYYNTVNQVGGQSGQTSDSHVWIDQLQPNTTYYWWVSSACNQTWVAGGSFTTLPDPAASGCWKMLVPGLSNSYTLAIHNNGTLWAWGKNTDGQLGNGTYTSVNVPTLSSNDNTWVKVSAGGYHNAAIKNDGTLWTWGLNINGELGDGTTIAKNIPVQVGSGTDWAQVAVGDGFTIAIKTNGTLWAWGVNGSYQLGDGTNVNKITPVQIGTATNWKSVGAGFRHAVAVRTNGTLWAWGENELGQLGDGTIIDRSTPTQITTATNWAEVYVGYEHNLALKTNGTLWGWGSNSKGEVGNGATAVRVQSPVQVGTDTNWKSAAAGRDHSLGVKTNGTLWSWGSNSGGELGDITNFSFSRTSPGQVGTATDWDAVSASQSNSFAGKNGLMHGWGYNFHGNLGIGTNTSSTPQITAITCPQVPSTCNPPTGLNVAQFGQNSAYLAWTAASPVPANGYIYRYNTVNNVTGAIESSTSQTGAGIDQLQPNTTYYWWVASACEPLTWVPGGSFTTLPAPVDLTCFTQISAGAYHSVGIKADGTLWAWGDNGAGQLGTGTGNQSTPKQVGTANDWQSVAASTEHTMAIKTNGTLWAWGNSGNGRLGNGVSAAGITAPVQIGTATNWKSVKAGEGHTLALKTNGTLWAWGFNYYGQVGDNTDTDRTTPVQIGTATNWKEIYTGAYHSYAIKTDGTLWGWGLNLYGQLGDATTQYKVAPAQIAITGIQSFASGGFHAVAVKTNGTLWAWGNNDEGQLGDNSTTTRTSPVQIGTSTTWTLAGAGDQHSMAVTANGVLYSWGLNNKGQLGVGSTTNKLIPTYVNTNFDGWTAITGGYQHTVAMLEDGKLWVAGDNADGQLGVTGMTSSTYLTDVACPTSAPLSNSEFETVAAMKLYPNPVNDVLTVALDSEITSVAIYNLLGQEVIAKTVNAAETTVGVSGLRAGTYFVRVTSGNEVKTSKIVKN